MTPAQADDLTLAEIDVMCSPDKDDECWSDADLRAYGEWWDKLTYEQRLWLKFDG